MTASVALGQVILVPLLPRLHALHPGLQLDLRFSDNVVDLIGQQVDIALRQSPSVDESLVGMRLRPLRMRVCASPDYIARHGRPTSPSDLGSHNCLCIALPGFRGEWSFRQAGASIATEEVVCVGGWLVASSALTLKEAALDGLGLVLLADWLLDADVAAGRLVDLFPALEVSSAGFDNAVWLLYVSREHMPRRVRVVVDFLKTAIQVAME